MRTIVSTKCLTWGVIPKKEKKGKMKKWQGGKFNE